MTILSTPNFALLEIALAVALLAPAAAGATPDPDLLPGASATCRVHQTYRTSAGECTALGADTGHHADSCTDLPIDGCRDALIVHCDVPAGGRPYCDQRVILDPSKTVLRPIASCTVRLTTWTAYASCWAIAVGAYGGGEWCPDVSDDIACLDEPILYCTIAVPGRGPCRIVSAEIFA